MFRRPESLRERTLLRIIADQSRTISEQNDRLMAMVDKHWNVAPAHLALEDEEPEESPFYTALAGLPPGYDAAVEE